MSQQKESVENQWTKVEDYLNRLDHEVFNRLIPFLTAAKVHPVLKKLYPFTGHEFLHFCDDIANPLSSNYPCVGPIPNMSEQTLLMAAKQASDFETSALCLQGIMNQYEFLREQDQPYIDIDEDNTIIGLSDTVDAVNWIIEQTREKYLVFIDNYTATDLQKPQILGIVDAQGAIDLLVERISDTNPDFLP